MTDFNKMQLVKRRFFAMRNGVVADALRRNGSPYKVIFGLNLPQIKDIAAEYAGDTDLAVELWQNGTTRESRLMAPLLVRDDSGLMSGFAEGVEFLEEADIVNYCLQKSPAVYSGIISAVERSDRPMHRYMALRMAHAHVDSDPATALGRAERELASADSVCRTLALTVAGDARYWINNG